MAATTKEYLYKIYDTLGNYIGTWADVFSEFSTATEINSAGSQVEVLLARAADSFNEGIDVGLNFRVKVYCSDVDNINGILLFQGIVSKYTPIYGLDEHIVVTLLGYGSEADNYIIETGESLDVSQATSDSDTGISNAANYYVGQTFKPGTTGSISRIEIRAAINAVVGAQSGILSLYSGVPGGVNALLGSAAFTIDDTGVFKIYSVPFASPIAVTAGLDYFFWLKSDLIAGGGPTPIQISYIAAGAYANGTRFHATSAPAITLDTGDLWFQTYLSAGSTTSVYTSQDPGAILKDLIDDFNNRGGVLTYSGTIDLTGTLVSYTFNTNTVLEGIKKCLELAPANWYWYVDQATNLLHFHRRPDVAEHSFVIGRDIQSFSAEKRVEDMVNTIYFTGGGGLFKRYTRQASIDLYGVKLKRYVDQRVLISATADIIATSILDARNAPEVRLEAVIEDNNVQVPSGYDIESISVGDVAVFRGLGAFDSNLWDVAYWDQSYWDYNIAQLGTLILQVVRLEYAPDAVRLFLSTIPPDVNKRIEDINRSLQASQTVNNPSAPS